MHPPDALPATKRTRLAGARIGPQTRRDLQAHLLPALSAVEELVRNFVGENLPDELDFGTLEALPSDRISGSQVKRQLKLRCKIGFLGSWLYLLILLEFQSESDYFMALRIGDSTSA